MIKQSNFASVVEEAAFREINRYKAPELIMTNFAQAIVFLLGVFLAAIVLAAPPSAPTGLCLQSLDGTQCTTTDTSTSTTPTTSTIVAPKSVKNLENFHPGYYLYLGKSNGSPLQAYMLSDISSNPDFVGIKRTYNWRLLEPKKGTFDFSVIEQDLALVQSYGKQMWVTITYNEYNSSLGPNIPTYMFSDSSYGCGSTYYGAYQGNEGSWRPCLWNKNLQARLAAVYTALGTRFNKEPYFEGTNLGETAINTAGAVASPGYSESGVEEGFKVAALAAKRAFPDKTVMQMINFGVFDLVDFTSWLVANEIGIGSPDTKLSNTGLVGTIYPQYLTYHNLVPTGPDVQWGNYEEYNSTLGRTNTASELLAGAIQYTNPWYMFWQNRDPYFTDDVLPAIRKRGNLPAAQQFYDSKN